MGWFRNDAEQAPEAAPWDGPFAPTPLATRVRFNPLVKTAAELAGYPQDAPMPAVAPTAA